MKETTGSGGGGSGGDGGGGGGGGGGSAPQVHSFRVYSLQEQLDRDMNPG